MYKVCWISTYPSNGRGHSAGYNYAYQQTKIKPGRGMSYNCVNVDTSHVSKIFIMWNVRVFGTSLCFSVKEWHSQTNCSSHDTCEELSLVWSCNIPTSRCILLSAQISNPFCTMIVANPLLFCFLWNLWIEHYILHAHILHRKRLFETQYTFLA